MTELKGICVPICTPFQDNGASLDERALEANIDSFLEHGVHIIAVNGGTGEFPFLTGAEKRRIAEVAAQIVAQALVEALGFGHGAQIVTRLRHIFHVKRAETRPFNRIVGITVIG